jgi:hypothetical protein
MKNCSKIKIFRVESIFHVRMNNFSLSSYLYKTTLRSTTNSYTFPIIRSIFLRCNIFQNRKFFIINIKLVSFFLFIIQINYSKIFGRTSTFFIPVELIILIFFQLKNILQIFLAFIFKFIISQILFNKISLINWAVWHLNFLS